MKGIAWHRRASRKAMPCEFQERDNQSIESLDILSEVVVVALIALPLGRLVGLSKVQATLGPATFYDVVVKRRTTFVVKSFKSSNMLFDKIVFSNAPLCHCFDAFGYLSGPEPGVGAFNI
jgi:hypothetical protein